MGSDLSNKKPSVVTWFVEQIRSSKDSEITVKFGVPTKIPDEFGNVYFYVPIEIVDGIFVIRDYGSANALDMNSVLIDYVRLALVYKKYMDVFKSDEANNFIDFSLVILNGGVFVRFKTRKHGG